MLHETYNPADDPAYDPALVDPVLAQIRLFTDAQKSAIKYVVNYKRHVKKKTRRKENVLLEMVLKKNHKQSNG